MAAVREIADVKSFEDVLNSSGSQLVVAHFSAAWAPQCQQMNEVLEELNKDSQLAKSQFLKIEAEDLPELSEKYEIAAVPTFIFFKNKSKLDRIDGANAAELTKKVKALSSLTSVPIPDQQPTTKQDINERLKGLVSSAPVMVFMKGVPGEPKCGFSRQLMQILNDRNVKFSSYDILEDEDVRQGLKKYSNWPTYPQLYVNGELLGGLDIIKELIESGEFQSQLPEQVKLEDRLKSLINKAPVMLFMKGDPQVPRCGFSRQVTTLLGETGVPYETFDILSDDEVRQGLKKFSNWPTYPQLYVKGELVGGLDILQQLKESGELESILKEGQ